jgi:DNA-binding NarL/FixJ family response regulator
VVAADLYDDVLVPYEAARAREAAAGHLFAVGQAAAAGGQLRRAIAAYHSLGASWDYGRAAAAARSRGVRLPPGRRGGVRKSYGTSLSPREREVAELAATGRRNKEIAADLFLSIKTVDKHMAAAMRKLNVQSRTALAVRLNDDDKSNDEVSPP